MARKSEKIIRIIGIKRILNFGMNFKDKKIVIFGLGNYRNGSGISAALFFAKEGAKLLITDLKTKKELSPQSKRLSAQGRSASGGKKFQNIKYVLGKHRIQDFKSADYIFKNPSVPKDSPYLKIARKNKIPIINDWSIFFDRRPTNLLIGITGSKGKSTATALIYRILKTAKKDVVLCGNIGQSPLAVLNKIKKNTIVVAELSSWLLQEFKNIHKSPKIAVITNLLADHLDKYKNIKEYYSDKANIFKFQGRNDYLILNKDDKNLRALAENAKSKKIWFSPKTPYSAGLAVAKILRIPAKTVKKALKNFKGLPARLELIAKKNDIKYYNDTTATMPDATIYALKSLKQYKGKIILIAGGVNKKLDYKKLTKEISKYAKALILFNGSASEKILKELKGNKEKLNILTNIETVKEAVKLASKFASKNDIILLSPGAASFNMFKNEFDRGGQFNKFVKQLK